MNVSRSSALPYLLAVLLLAQSGCFFSGGVSTFNKTTHASGSGFLSVTERNGQWDADGPPPRVGDATERTIYRKMEKTTAFSLGYFGKIYELSDPYPHRRSHIAAIREVGTDSESGGTVHYYEVEFDPETGG
jgi:hypothetical protein